MAFPSTLRSLARFLLLAVFSLSFVASLEAQPTTENDSLQLTEQKVRDWIKTRIATNKLQNKMKANAPEYDDVVQAFFAERKTLLQSRGWTVDEFEAVEKRIGAATSAMDMADDLEESKVDHEEQVAQIQDSEFYSEKQKEEMIEAMSEVREQQKTKFIEPTKPDWPVVKPYRSTLEELTDWVAGNTPNPPELP